MYLKSIEIQGFKSFADRHVFDFDQGISAIVGPNGSGKSNIVDAIRWALGEQSAKSLRGGKMEDVIFSGSGGRRAVGMARVTLILDNSKRELDLDRDEVEIQRALHRSGESEYKINRQTCRLKDIHELFMDTGIGRDGFSVIGQGKIDEVLMQHAEERRSLIEEAAGISKYKYRKREAQRRLDATKEDMERLDDLLYELEGRLEPLEKQATKVQQFRELESEERALFLADLAKNYSTQKSLLDRLEEGLESLEDRFQKQQAAILKQDTKRLDSLRERDQLRQKMDKDQARFLELTTNRQKLEAQILLSREKNRQADQEIARVQKEVSITNSKKENIIRSIEVAAEKSTAQKNAFQSIEKKLQASSDSYRSQEKELFDLKACLDEGRNRQFELFNKRAFINTEKSRILQSQDGFNYREERHNQRLESLQEAIRSIQLKLEEDTNSEKILEKELIKSQDKINKLSEKVQALNHDNIQNQKEFMSINQKSQVDASRLETLKELEESGEGYYAGVRALLKAQKNKKETADGVLGTIGQILTLDDNYVTAYDIALGAASQNVVVEHDRQASKIIEWLKKERLGRVTFMPLNTIQLSQKQSAPKGDGLIGNMAELAHYDQIYEKVVQRLLGRSWLVEDLKSARKMAKDNQFAYRLVTLEGDILAPGGSMTGGAQKRQGQLLHRGSEIRRLEDSLKKTKKQKSQLQKKLSQGSDKLRVEEEKLEAAKTELQDKRLELSSLIAQKEQKHTDFTRLQQDIALEGEDRKLLSQELASSEDELKELEVKNEVLNRELADLEAEMEDLQIKIYTKEKALESSRKALQKLEILHAREAEKTAYEERSYMELEEQVKSLNLNLEAFNKQIRKSQELKSSLEEELIENKQNLEKLAISYQVHEEESKLRKDAMEDAQSSYQILEEELKKSERILREMESQQQNDQRRHDQIAMQITRYEDNLTDHYDLTLEEAINEADLSLNTDQASKRIRKLRAQKQALGELNFTAPEEYLSLINRVDFLSIQLNDLREGKTKLEQVIGEMENTMLGRFRKTFDQVNRQFKMIFQGMFEGGYAELSLSLPDNLLESGIEIIAKPPGKKASVLSLLSGGERAMTAIALLFALQEVRPSPFVVLDEIEAALDEANIQRFTNFLKRYAEHTQFIIISHRRGTMAAAQVLYGVTMDQSGVSSQVSVRLSEEGAIL